MTEGMTCETRDEQGGANRSAALALDTVRVQRERQCSVRRVESLPQLKSV